ncbi:SMC5-SMC6 complex localization factor protein 2 isoform X2 [Colossoma macropomum]|uniref:SMC5-SMC6 complex localization factor protein 2 isoform X2 n=1 Tax=Colossoma macropomum TaxID=42526 RepID=UPI001863D1C2|nr:SMC5-SMC6 complex localization factor protein 2 isoform X2 [Colossoma macropomum]
MKSNLKQHITSMVKDIIPLGVPRRSSADETSTIRLVTRRPSQEPDNKNVNTLGVLNPLPKRMLPLKSPELEHTSTSAVASSSGSKKSSGGGQDGLSNNNVLMRKLQINNNNNIHSSKDGSLQSAAKKGVLFQRTNSYNKEREFALALCKQLNENLKVEKVMLHSGSPPQQSPVSPLPVSRPFSESHASSTSQREGRNPGSSVEQRVQHSAEKEDKLLNGDRSSSLHSPVSSCPEESTPSQTTTPGGRLSLKRQRESSTDGKREGKRLRQEDSCLTPSSANISSSTGAQSISSPPKYVKCAILKTSSEKGSLILEDRKKTSSSLSSSLARQLFKEPSREPRSENCKPQLVTQPSNVSGIGRLKDEKKKSNESKCQVVSSLTADTSPLLSCKLTQKCRDERSSAASSHTSSLPGLINEIKISSPPHQSELKAPTSIGPMGSKKGEIKTPKQDPDSSPRASLPSTPAKQDGEKKRGVVWKDPLDLELGYDGELGLESCALSLNSSSSSDEEQLLSLQEILERSARVPTTPEKGAFSEPSTPAPKATPQDLKSKVKSYKNTLEQMLKEKEQNQKSKELEMQLLQACKEDLLKLEEDEENENAEAALSHEQREFLQKFSVTSCAIKDIHPGEEVFTLANFGRLFDHQSLDLRKISVTPNNRAQQTLLQAPTEHVLLLLSAGLFRRAYSTSSCQPQVTRWLFQMMSVHPNPSTCAQILQAMTTIALSAAQHIVENSSKKFEVWVPSIQDVALVFLNMGVSFVNLFPLEALQPPFTEGDLLESLEIQPDRARTEKERDTFPEYNFENIVKYLALCAALCPRAYTDEELLLLLTLMCRVSLETSLQLLPTGDLSCLLQHILQNMTQWEIQLPQVCQAIIDLTEDHHNLRRLVQLLPYSVRGKQLRRHLSVSIISKLLNHRCTYKPSCVEFQLSDLRSYLPRMRPSSLLKGFIATQKEQQETEDCALTPDQQAYYLCYSLLALTNEASNFEFLPSNQRNELLLLSAELEKHIKCDIRESEKMLYRSKVKDFVARIYTRWQVLLQRSRPQEGKLYDYWKPLPEDEMPINEESLSTEHPKQEATEEPQSGDSNSAQSEDEEWVEAEDDLPIKSEEELEESVGETEEKNRVVQEGLGDTKVDEQLVKLDDEDEEEKRNTPVDEGSLEGGSPEEFMESDIDEEVIKREDELLKDEEPLQKDGGLMERENDELEELGLLEKELLE